MDADIVIRAQQGDQRAFEALARSAHPRLYRIALGVLGDPATADDATQQALLSIWRDLPQLRDPAKFDGWSYRLVVRSCYAEAKRRPSWLPDTGLGDGDQTVAADAFTDIVQRDALAHAFPRLSAEHRAVIVLRYLLDLPLAEVAEALDVSVGTVGSRTSRALAALRAELEADARPPAALARQRSDR